MTFSTPMKDATKNLTIDLDTTGPEGCGGDSVECVGGGGGGRAGTGSATEPRVAGESGVGRHGSGRLLSRGDWGVAGQFGWVGDLAGAAEIHHVQVEHGVQTGQSRRPNRSLGFDELRIGLSHWS